VNGEPLWKLHRIEDKYTHNGQLVYGIMYYEEKPRHMYAVETSEVELKYPHEVQTWETHFGKTWERRHGARGSKMGNPWISGAKPPSTPAGNRRSSSAASDKRSFHDTPGKAKQEPQQGKKTKKDDDPCAIYDFPKDDDEDLGDAIPEDDEDVFGSTGATANSSSSKPGPMAPPPRPLPKFKTPLPVTSAPLVDDDDDIEDSPTRPSVRSSHKSAASIMPSSPTKGASNLLRIPIRATATSQVGQTASTPSLGPSSVGSGSMAPPPRSSSVASMSGARGRAGRFPASGSNIPVLQSRPGVAPTQVSANSTSIQQAPSSRNLGAQRPTAVPSSLGRMGSSAPPAASSKPQAMIPARRTSPIPASNAAPIAAGTSTEESDSDDEPLLRRRSRKSTSLDVPSAPAAARHSNSDDDSTQDEGNASGQDANRSGNGMEDSDDEQDGGVLLSPEEATSSQKGTDESEESPAADAPTGATDIRDSDAEDDESIENLIDVDGMLEDANQVGEAAYAESQMEMQEEANEHNSEDEDEEPPLTQARLDDGTLVYDNYSEKLIRAHSNGIYALVRVVMALDGMPCDRWVKNRKESKVCDYKDLKFVLWIMMIGWDPLILKHLVHGDIPSQYQKGGELSKKLRALKNLPKNIETPSIYMQYLVDLDGNAPPQKDLLKILDYAEDYVQGLNDPSNKTSHALALVVDQALPSKVWNREKAMRGERRYIEGRTQARKCNFWIAAARQRLEGLSPDESLARPWAECGYATHPNERLDQHAKHTSSNYLMNLTDAICKTQFQGKYIISQFVVHQIIHYTHAMYGEVLASRIGLVYTNQGGGFSHFQAGVSHASVSKTDKGHFSRKQTLTSNNKAFLLRINEEFCRMQEKTDLLNEYADQVQREEDVIGEMYALAQVTEEFVTDLQEKKKQWAATVKETDTLLAFLEFTSKLKGADD